VAMNKTGSSIVYFEGEGRDNLVQVLRIIQRRMRKDPTLRTLKVVIFTAFGEGPARAHSMLQEFDPHIIAFPRTFTVKNGEQTFTPQIQPKLKKFFDGVGIKVLGGRLPFDEIKGFDAHNREMRQIRDVFSVLRLIRDRITARPVFLQ
jgi:hypothetical protein